MSLIYSLGAFFFGYRAFREYQNRKADTGSNKAVPFFLLSLMLTLMGLCGLFGFFWDNSSDSEFSQANVSA